MTTVERENVLLTHPNYKTGIKESYDNSASTISDCYSSDDEYKEGILHDYHLNQSTVLLSHESIAFEGDQYESIPIMNDEKFDLIKKKTPIINKNSNFVNNPKDERLSKCKSNIYPDIEEMKTRCPDFPFEKCLTEFYRPPSRSKNSFAGMKRFTENESISPQHFIESSIETAYKNTKPFQTDTLSNSLDIGNVQNSATSLFNCSSQFQSCNMVSNDDSTIKMLSSTSLNSRTQSESVKHNYSDRNSNCDFKSNPLCRSRTETFTHSVLFRKPKSQTIKSTTAQSMNSLQEQATQTTYKLELQEKCVGTLKINVMTDKKLRYESGDTGDSMMNLDSATKEFTNIDLSRNLFDLLQLLQKHVNTVVGNLKRCLSNKKLGSMETDDAKDKLDNHIESDEMRFNHSYPPKLVIDLYKQIKQLYHQLDTQLKCVTANKKSCRHQRYYSDVVKNVDRIHDNNDFNRYYHELDNDFCETKAQNLSVKPVQSIVYHEPDFIYNSEQPDWISRVFELGPYDDLIKSFQSNTDRRIKAVANRMKCKIIIEGPFRLYDSTNACWNMRNKTAYRCYLHGHSKESVDKCLKCLQDTFPQSCLNEKHVIYRLETKHYTS